MHQGGKILNIWKWNYPDKFIWNDSISSSNGLMKKNNHKSYFKHFVSNYEKFLKYDVTPSHRFSIFHLPMRRPALCYFIYPTSIIFSSYISIPHQLSFSIRCKICIGYSGKPFFFLAFMLIVGFLYHKIGLFTYLFIFWCFLFLPLLLIWYIFSLKSSLSVHSFGCCLRQTCYFITFVLSNSVELTLR